jgi:hypothetical protein
LFAWGATEWTAFGATLSGIGTVLAAIAVWSAARKGASVFDDWRKQRISERLIAQAEEILTISFKSKEALERIRYPILWADELNIAKQQILELGEHSMDSPDFEKHYIFRSYMNRLGDVILDKPELEEMPLCRLPEHPLCKYVTRSQLTD